MSLTITDWKKSAYTELGESEDTYNLSTGAMLVMPTNQGHNTGEQIISMMHNRSGMWDITSDRVELLTRHLSRLSPSSRSIVDDMLRIADSGERLWMCKAEYYSALQEIRRISQKPSSDDLKKTLLMVIDSSKTDRVDHREWVKETIRVIEALIDAR